jgi:signal peptidase II
MAKPTNKSMNQDSAGLREAGTTAEPAQMRKHERWILFIIAISVILLDQLTKEIVRSNMPLYTSWAPFPAVENFFRFTHATNTGVAFGLFQNGNGLFAIFASAIAIGIIVFNQRLSTGNPLLRVALGLQLGGAIGNLIDRLMQGWVTDFLDFGPWPVFNVADMAVVGGVILLAYIMLQEDRKESARQKEAKVKISETTGAAKAAQHDESPTS